MVSLMENLKSFNVSSSRSYKYFCFTIAASVWFYAAYFRTSFGPIADVLENEFDTNTSGVTLINSVYYLTYSFLVIPYGILLQKISPKYLLLYSAFGFAISSLLFSFSNNLVYATIISGICGGLTAPTFISIIKLVEEYWFTTKELPFIIGLQTFFGYSLLFAFRYIQAAVYEKYKNWQITYYFFSICSFLTFIIFLFIVIYDHKREYNKNNSEADDHELLDVTHDKTYKYTAADHDPQVPPYSSITTKLKYAICNRLNWLLCIWGFCAIVIINGFNGLWLINYLRTKFSYSRSLSALISGLYYFTRAFVAIVYGKLAMYYKKRKIFLIIATLSWSGSIFIIYCPQNTHLSLIIIASIISGSGAPIWNILWTLTREYNNYYKCKDIASGMITSIANLGGFSSQLFIAELIDISFAKNNNENGEDNKYTVDNYNDGFIVIPFIILLALIVVLMLKETNARNLDHDYFSK
eukprot:10970_1